jgi:hypothetical protein
VSERRLPSTERKEEKEEVETRTPNLPSGSPLARSTLRPKKNPSTSFHQTSNQQTTHASVITGLIGPATDTVTESGIVCSIRTLAGRYHNT